jgi:hypothetical protein
MCKYSRNPPGPRCRSITKASWSEAFAVCYDEWSAGMTEDVPFYVQLAREADGRSSSLRSGNGT